MSEKIGTDAADAAATAGAPTLPTPLENMERRAREIALKEWSESVAVGQDIERCFSALKHDDDCDGLPLECARCTADMFRNQALEATYWETMQYGIRVAAEWGGRVSKKAKARILENLEEEIKDAENK
jgi:hypothetical protein